MPIIASDRVQAGVIFGYVANFFHDVPLLRKMLVSKTKDSLELNNGIRIEVHTCDYRSVRGYTLIGGICDEVSFWPTDERAASPDKEIINAIEKGMASIPSAMLVITTSPYGKVGEAWEGYERNYGKDTDELCWVGDSKSMNPTLRQKTIDRAYEKDPVAASSEYGAQFRSDVAGFLSVEAVAACVVPERYELAPRTERTFYAFCDPSGGSSDSMTLGIAHAEKDVAVLDLLREVIPPFSPEGVVKDFCDTLKRYRCYTVVGDRYAAEWVVEQFQKNGVSYTQSEKVKSDIYLSLLPAVNSGQIELLDSKRLITQLGGLERRTRSGGKDIVDHRSGLHDDLANAAAGALVLCGAGGGAYGWLDWMAGLAKGIFTFPSEPRETSPRDDLRGKRAAMQQEMKLLGVTSSTPQEPPPNPPCEKCKSVTVKIGGAGYRCSQCGHQDPGGLVLTQGETFTRSNLPRR